MNLLKEYKSNGFVGPIKLMEPDEALFYKSILVLNDNQLDLMKSDYRCKSNVLFPWVDEITRNKKLIKIVSELIGENFHCWDVLFWIKKPNDGKDVGFHQDSTYWNFDNPTKAVTVWFAFDDVLEEHGPIEYVKGTHKKILKHVDIKRDNNLLMRGQTVKNIPKGELVSMPCPIGHALIHGPFIIHGSKPNISDTTRYAMGMIFVSTECKPIITDGPESTIMIHGHDTYNHMIHDPKPTGFRENDLQNWKVAYDRQHLNYYKMKQRAENV